MTREDYQNARKYLNTVYQELKQPTVVGGELGEKLAVGSFKVLKKAIRLYRSENQTEGGEVLKG